MNTQSLEKRRASKRAYYARNKQKIIERAAVWRRNNPEEARARARKHAARYRAANLASMRKYKRERHLKAKYGLTVEQYDAMFKSQDCRCAVCLSPTPNSSRDLWHTDHCHTTGVVRGILCSRCNLLIGQAADSPERLRAAANYLERSGGLK